MTASTTTLGYGSFFSFGVARNGSRIPGTVDSEPTACSHGGRGELFKLV